jgi:hypothetical protein
MKVEYTWPDVREDVYRNPQLQLNKEDFVTKTEVFDGLIAE